MNEAAENTTAFRGAAEDVSAPGRSPAIAPDCAHCGLPVPPGLIETGAPAQFCCHGCRGAYAVIRDCGLERYYEVRDHLAATGQPAQASARRFAELDQPAYHRQHVRSPAEGLLAVDWRLAGVHCAACVWLVERLPRVVPGVVEARLSLRGHVARIVIDPGQTAFSTAARALARLGYAPQPERDAEGGERLVLAEERRALIRLAIAGAAAGNAMLLAAALYAGWFGGIEPAYERFFQWVGMVIGLISLAWPGAVFFRGAWAAVRLRTPHLDLPIALALGIGGLAGVVNTVTGRGEAYFDSLAVLVFLLLVGRFIQQRQQRRAEKAVELLYQLTPGVVRRYDADGQLDEVPLSSLQPGDRVEVLPGGIVPCDGAVVVGRSRINQALLSGEADPVPVTEGSPVLAGTVNEGSPLVVEVVSVGEKTRAGRLMGLVERGVAEKPPAVALADRMAGYFTAMISLIAATVFIVWARWDVGLAIDHTVALLIVACPCALGLATPLTLAMDLGRAAQRGILIKSGAALDRLGTRVRLILDKTGTLTTGRMTLTTWFGPPTVRSAVALIERHSTHPIAQALVAACEAEATRRIEEEQLVRGSVEESAGGITGVIRRGGIERRYHLGSEGYLQRHGMTLSPALRQAATQAEARRQTPVFVAEAGRVVALAALGDRVHEGAAEDIARLQALGCRVSVLSGDRPAVVERIAAEVGIDAAAAQGGMDPEGKLAVVRALSAAGGAADEPVVMVGDGVNDAAALGAAAVGIAVHGGAEVSLAAADIYLTRPGLRPVVELMQMARRTRWRLRRNMLVSLGYNLSAVGLAAFGFMNPLLAAVVMPVSSATVVALAIGRAGKGR